MNEKKKDNEQFKKELEKEINKFKLKKKIQDSPELQEIISRIKKSFIFTIDTLSWFLLAIIWITPMYPLNILNKFFTKVTLSIGIVAWDYMSIYYMEDKLEGKTELNKTALITILLLFCIDLLVLIFSIIY